MKKKSQGEIFGIALMFVVIIIGIIVYSQVKVLNPNRDADLQSEGEYKILAEGTLNTLLDASTGCYVEQGRDSVMDLVNYCLEFSFSKSDPEFICDNPIGEVKACSHFLSILNNNLNKLFNSEKLGPIPFELKVEVPQNPNSVLNNRSITNFGNITLLQKNITLDNYRKEGYKRAPSGLKTWATAQRNVNFELYLYYK